MQLISEKASIKCPTSRQMDNKLDALLTREKRIATQRVARLELELHEAKLFGKEPDRSFKGTDDYLFGVKRRTKGYARLQSGAKPLLAFFYEAILGEIRPSSVEKYVGYRSIKEDGTIKKVETDSFGCIQSRYKKAWLEG